MATLSSNWKIETNRLIIRPATDNQEDISFLFKLWTNPEVMKFVGFPSGLKITPDKIKEQLISYGHSEYDRVLLAFIKGGTSPIGECKLGEPDKDSIAHTDIKLQPEFWGRGYGKEIKKALVDYLFEHTTCEGVRATPNEQNIASIKMQEAIGATRIKSGCYRFPESMRSFTTDVNFVEYIIYRADWEE